MFGSIAHGKIDKLNLKNDSGLCVVSAPMQVTNLTPLCQNGLDRSRPGNAKEQSSNIALCNYLNPSYSNKCDACGESDDTPVSLTPTQTH